MFSLRFTKPPRLTLEEYSRAVAYLILLTWAILFEIYPPLSVADLDPVTRSVWMSVVMLGAVAAFIGVITRIDLKLELPGILLSCLGPLFYAFANLYLVIFPLEPEVGVNPRISIVVYVVLPLALMLPRAFALITEADRLRKAAN